MTIRKVLDGIILEVNDEISRLWSLVVSPPIERLRPAKPSDIVKDTIIYYHPHKTQQYIQIVMEVRYPDDDFKAYVAEDGCRYGLSNAFVEKEPNE